MLPLNGRPIISNNVDHLRANGVNEVSIVVGYKKEGIQVDDSRKFENVDFENNNILFSLMYATPIFEQAIAERCDLVISYSDIVYSSELVKNLLSRTDDFVIAVDLDWRKQYDGRTEHPISEAEKIELNDRDEAVKLGKVVPNDSLLRVGEFIGLLKLSPTGAEKWLSHFEHISEALKSSDPFQNTPELRKAYLTDFLQDLVDTGTAVSCSTFHGGWMEFDAAQDYEKLLATWTSPSPLEI